MTPLYEIQHQFMRFLLAIHLSYSLGETKAISFLPNILPVIKSVFSVSFLDNTCLRVSSPTGELTQSLMGIFILNPVRGDELA